MKNIYLIISILLLCGCQPNDEFEIVCAQTKDYSLNGTVKSLSNLETINNAQIIINELNTSYTVYTDNNGFYEINGSRISCWDDPEPQVRNVNVSGFSNFLADSYQHDQQSDITVYNTKKLKIIWKDLDPLSIDTISYRLSYEIPVGTRNHPRRPSFEFENLEHFDTIHVIPRPMRVRFWYYINNKAVELDSISITDDPIQKTIEIHYGN